jgi:Tfp pilus assembly protein PilX
VLRTNLSTRPFYNERGVHLVLAAAAMVVVALTVFNALRIVTLSRQNTELSSIVNRDHEEAQRLTREAQKIRASMNQDELQATAEAAEAANLLIEQRTFSWTEFFNHIEATLPPDVMLTAVQPSFKNNVTMVQMTVLGRRTEDVDQFMEKLEATGAFQDVLPSQEDPTEEGLHRVSLSAIYAAAGAADQPAAPPETAKPAETGEPGPAPEGQAKPDAPSPRGKDAAPPGSRPGRGGRGQ